MKKKNLLIAIVGLFAFIMMVGGVSYSYFTYNKDIAVVSLDSGDIAINFNNVTNSINILNAIPTSDAMGKMQDNYLDFTVTGTADIETLLYEIQLIPQSGSTIDTNYIKVYLTDQDDNEILSPFLYSELYNCIKNDGKTLYQDLVQGNSDGTTRNYTKNYRLRIWIDENYGEVTSETINYNIYLYAQNINSNEYSKITFDLKDGRKLIEYVQKGEGINLPTPVRKGYVLQGWKTLPSEYERYEYIETDGTQFFDCNYVFNNNIRIKVDFMTSGNIPTDKSTVLFYSGSGGNNYGFALGSSAINGRVRAFYNSVWNGTTFLSVNTRYKLYFDKEKLYLNDNLIHTFSSSTFTNSYTMPFFAQYYNNLNPINYASSGTRIYYIQIYDNDDLVRYLVPALNKNTNIVGMYDMVNDIFYTNPGNSSFTGSVLNENTINDEEIIIASWNHIPTLELSQVTYLEQDLSTWTSADTTISVEDGFQVATLNSTNSTLTSAFIPVNGKSWYIEHDGYVTNSASVYSPNGGIFGVAYFYDYEHNSTGLTQGSNIGRVVDGFAVGLTINEWVNNIVSPNFWHMWDTTIRFVKIVYKYQDNGYSSNPPVKIRNLKVYGQMENDFYLINVSATDIDGNITSMKYDSGNHDASYFANNGYNVLNNQIRVTANGIYTVYIQDDAGNEVVDTIVIGNIR